MSETRAQRQAALEERRRRIADLREQRNRRQEDTARVQASATANLDDYVTGLLNEPAPSLQRSVSQEEDEQQQAATTIVGNEATQNAAAAAAHAAVSAAVAAAPAQKHVETFAVGTQTDFVEEEEREYEEKEEKEEKEASKKESSDHVDDKDEEKADTTVVPKVLSSEQVEKEVSSTPFSTFIHTASKKVERMLGTPLLAELLVDTVGAADDDDIDSSRKQQQLQQQDDSKFVAARQVYECPKWTQGRDVTDMDWSPLHRELVLSTYHHHAASSSSSTAKSAAISAISPNDTPSASLTPRSGELQSDGLAAVWSLSMPNRPEHVFTCGSPVTAGRFHPTDATLILGGCQSGQLVVWDIRAGRLPVQKSALTTIVGASQKGHAHPICSMAVLEGGAGFVTSSTDGKVNFWSLSNLREPAESLQLPGDSVSCFAVAPESDTLILGDETGALYTAPAAATGQRRRQVRKMQVAASTTTTAASDEQATAAVDSTNTSLGGHYGVVTAISTKKLRKTATARAAGVHKGFLRGSGGLVLSAGVDWTVKLWAPAYRSEPLCSYVSHSYDYMSDVQWSPSHPALFATASSNGTVGLWNLAKSLDTPMTGPEGIVVEAGGGGIDIAAAVVGLNKIRWSLDGRRLAVAAADRMHMLTLTPEAIQSSSGGPEEDAKSMMNSLMARGWISSSRQ